MAYGAVQLRPPLVSGSPISDAVARTGIVPITVEQYLRMIEQGIVAENASTELLRGVLVRKDRSVIGEDPMGHSPMHKLAVALLTALAARVNSAACHVQIQLPVACPPDGAPEPDASIVRGTPRDYTDRLATAADVSCVIEAAHSSLARDSADKLPIYAEAGIPQYVILNLQNRTAEVYESPDPAGRQYRSRATLEADDALRLRLPEGQFEVKVADVLP